MNDQTTTTFLAKKDLINKKVTHTQEAEGWQKSSLLARRFGNFRK
jgi:hypothetical protein